VTELGLMERFEDWDETGDGPGESSKTHGATSHRVTGRIPVPDVNPEWISLDTVHAWMNTCRDLHNCGEYSSFGHAPAWLIDVQDNCLVPPPSNTVRYCALSYVWGQVKATKLTTANLDDFCKPGAFSVDNPSIDISNTIRHAIGLVRVLGERYIWVDALCIVQDDGAHFHAELRNMGAIYHKAYLTVVAATAWDANEGLRGLKGISARRHLASNFADDLHKYLDPETMIWVSDTLAVAFGQARVRRSYVAELQGLDFPGGTTFAADAHVLRPNRNLEVYRVHYRRNWHPSDFVGRWVLRRSDVSARGQQNTRRRQRIR
jgi:hypothetical protein